MTWKLHVETPKINDLCQDSIEGSDAHVFMPTIISTYLVKDLRYHDS